MFRKEWGIRMKAITDRRSIRKYKNIPLEEEKIKDILQAALLAPSAKNRQPWKFIVYQGDAKEQLVKAMEKGMEREKKGITDLPGFAYGLPDATHTLEIMKAVPVLVAVLNTNGGTFYEEIGRNRELWKAAILFRSGQQWKICCCVLRSWESALCGSPIPALPIMSWFRRSERRISSPVLWHWGTGMRLRHRGRGRLGMTWWSIGHNVDIV